MTSIANTLDLLVVKVIYSSTQVKSATIIMVTIDLSDKHGMVPVWHDKAKIIGVKSLVKALHFTRVTQLGWEW